MQAATTSANSHMDSNCIVTSHNHHHGSPEHPEGDSPNNGGHISGVPINVLSMQGNEGGQNNAVYTSGNMPLMYNSGGILYATPSTTQSTMSDGVSTGQSHHLVMQDGTVMTNQGIPVSLQHVPGALQVNIYTYSLISGRDIIRSFFIWSIVRSISHVGMLFFAYFFIFLIQVHQEYSNSLQHHSNGIHDNHSSPGDMVGMVDPLSVHQDGGMDKNMNSHK